MGAWVVGPALGSELGTKNRAPEALGDTDEGEAAGWPEILGMSLRAPVGLLLAEGAAEVLGASEVLGTEEALSALDVEGLKDGKLVGMIDMLEEPLGAPVGATLADGAADVLGAAEAL